MNRYKMKPGTTISDIENFAKKKKYVFNNGGTWISKDAEHCLFIVLNDDIDLDIAFPKDLKNWDDYNHVTVMDDNLGQPYGPFYKHLKNPAEKLDPYLKMVIEKYNEIMDSLPFLEKSSRFQNRRKLKMENSNNFKVTRKPKTKTFYGIWTTDDELHGSIKVYCRTKEIAKRELKKYRDWFCDKPPKPDDRHIKRFEMLIE